MVCKYIDLLVSNAPLGDDSSSESACASGSGNASTHRSSAGVETSALSADVETSSLSGSESENGSIWLQIWSVDEQSLCETAEAFQVDCWASTLAAATTASATTASVSTSTSSTTSTNTTTTRSTISSTTTTTTANTYTSSDGNAEKRRENLVPRSIQIFDPLPLNSSDSATTTAVRRAIKLCAVAVKTQY